MWQRVLELEMVVRRWEFKDLNAVGDILGDVVSGFAYM